jgi:hypothetical protein
MSEEITIFGMAIAGGIASKEVLSKLLGPTAEYLGNGMRDLVKISATNVSRIFTIACEKLKDGLDKKGQVNPRILKNILEEGRFVENIFSAEYFGGILASSRNEDGQDDSSLPYINLIKVLPSFHIHLHFIIYSLVAKFGAIKRGKSNYLNIKSLQLMIPLNQLRKSLSIKKNDSNIEVWNALVNLSENNLIYEHYGLKTDNSEKKNGEISFDEPGIIVRPTEKGAALFLKALGYQGLSPELIFSVDVEIRLTSYIKQEINLPPDVKYSIQPVYDTLYWGEDLEEKIENITLEMESRIDDIESDLDDLKSKKRKQQ